MKRVLLGALALVVLLAGVVVFGTMPSRDPAGMDPLDRNREAADEISRALDAGLIRLDSAVSVTSRKFEGVDDLKTAQEQRLRRYQNAQHLARARALGTGRISGQDEVDRLVEEGRLIRIEDNPYYYLQDLTLSVPYVTPDAARLLDEIGRRFHDQLRSLDLPLYRYNISSVLRTEENQQQLRRINPNAARGVSTHEYGTTLDIVYHTYEYHPVPEDVLPPTSYGFLNVHLEKMRIRAYDALGMRYWQELQGILGRVLINLQDDGAVLVTLEREQPVFHITVARSIE